MKIIREMGMIVATATLGLSVLTSQAFAASSGSLDILRQSLLGAGTGAIASSASGGNAGKGALIGAGTNVIGGALLGFLTDSSNSSQQATYVQPYYQVPQSYYSAPQPQPVYQQPIYQPAPAYVQPESAYVQPTPVYAQPPMDSNKQIITRSLLGAGTGAIAAGVSGGNAGTGALIGAGTSVIGSVLLDMLTGPSMSQPASNYYNASHPVYSSRTSNSGNANPLVQKHIIRKYDANGNVVSEEEILQ